jgi:small-conductance mechanosensitive channel
VRAPLPALGPTDPTDPSWASRLTEIAATLGLRFLLAVVALLLLWGLYWLARRAARRALRRTTAHVNARLLVDRFVQFGFLFIAVTWLLTILGVPLTAFVAVVGTAGLAISLSLQDVLRNLVAGLIILVERPFAIGEHIDFRTFSGVVETIELRTTVLRTPTGQRVVIPNALIFSDALVNRSAYGRQLVRLRVAVPLDEDQPAATPTDRLADEVAGVLSGMGLDGPPGPPATPSPSPPPTAAPPDAPQSSVLVESLTKEKVTLRAEAWARDSREAVPRLAWALRRRLPGAEITVLE